MHPSEPLTPETTRGWFQQLLREMAEAVVGQQEVLEHLLLPLLCREHALIEAPAGGAKGLAITALGNCFGLEVRRLRSSPDLTLDDLIGNGPWRAIWGASLLVVENLENLLPKLQHVIHAAMAERIVPGAERLPVPDPFVVYATRYRPDDTSDLDEHAADDPAADRFLLQIKIPYPTYRDEYEMAAAKSSALSGDLSVKQLFTRSELERWQTFVTEREAAPSVIHYAVRLARATRVHEGENPDFIYEWVQRGAGPRAAHFLVLAAKARATLYGRAAATHDDIGAVALPVLRHRIVTNRNARTNGIDSDRVVKRLLNEIPPQVVGDDQSPAAGAALTFHDWVPRDDFAG